MAKVTRFFHIRRGWFATHGGATVQVSGDTNNVGSVQVRVAKCSKKDNYCKAIGRAVAEAAEPVNIPLRLLPRFMADVAIDVDSWHNFDYAVGYFLPKE